MIIVVKIFILHFTDRFLRNSAYWAINVLIVNKSVALWTPGQVHMYFHY